MTDPGLDTLWELISARSGTSLSEHQMGRVRSLVWPRLGEGGLEAYVARLTSPAGEEELAELISATLVHKTDLFRDLVQLDAFNRHVLEPLVHRARRPLHVWSAGCATGEEVATLLVSMAAAGADPGSTVLGSDLSSAVLERAKRFDYPTWALRAVPGALRERYFVPSGPDRWTLPDTLKQQARFARHNLVEQPYPRSPDPEGFDVIFCRNVLIYFTEDALAATIEALTARLRPGGTLVLSAAEPLMRRFRGLVTQRCDRAFFYVRSDVPESRKVRPSGPKPIIALRRAAARPGVDSAGERPYVPHAVTPGILDTIEETDALAEADRMFEEVLERAAGGDADVSTETGLRRCLYLDPHLAQARYLLGLLLEQRGEVSAASGEYRRALAALREGRSRPTPFFLNDERLSVACHKALLRLS